jgi:hypothetical protein
MSRLRFSILAALVAAPLMACAGAPRPEARIASTEGAIRGAQEAGARNVPAATLYLKLAEEQRQSALGLVKDGDNHRAEMLLERSEADANLAIAMARAASAEHDAQAEDHKIEELKEKAVTP